MATTKVLSKPLKAYKGFNKDSQGKLSCRAFTFEVGKTYTHKGDFGLCLGGFHFCKNPKNVLKYYDLFEDPEIVLGEIEASGKYSEDTTKSCAETIKVIRILSREETLKVLGMKLIEKGIKAEADLGKGYSDFCINDIRVKGRSINSALIFDKNFNPYLIKVTPSNKKALQDADEDGAWFTTTIDKYEIRNGNIHYRYYVVSGPLVHKPETKSYYRLKIK